MENILSLLIWLPVIGMVAIAFISREKEELIRITAAVTTGIQFLLTLFLWGDFDSNNGSMQFREWAEWIPSFNIAYHLGVDGLSLPMVILTGQVPTHLIGDDAFQEVDTVGITRPCVKHNFLVRDVKDLAAIRFTLVCIGIS